MFLYYLDKKKFEKFSGIQFLNSYLEILKEFIPPCSNCLELFARNLLPGWTSWGNEVRIDYY